MIVTRFAPSPTGLLHLGHAYAAFVAAQSGDDFLLRIEDSDQGRARKPFAEAIFRDLAWLGLTWDEPVLYQSARMDAYGTALAALADRGLVYPCLCTRKDIAQEILRSGEAPHIAALPAARTGKSDDECSGRPRQKGSRAGTVLLAQARTGAKA